MKRHTLQVLGMNGQHCVMLIQKLLARVGHVRIRSIEVGMVDIMIDEKQQTKESVISAIEQLGYRITGS